MLGCSLLIWNLLTYLVLFFLFSQIVIMQSYSCNQHIVCTWDKYCPAAPLAQCLVGNIRAETSEELLESKSMFASPRRVPSHNGRTCVQCIPWMPAGEVPYQSLQLFWCVAQRPPCPPPLHRPGMCSLWDSRLWERPVPPRCATSPRALQPPNDCWHLWSLQLSTEGISPDRAAQLSHRKFVTADQQLESMLRFTLGHQICFDLCADV